MTRRTALTLLLGTAACYAGTYPYTAPPYDKTLNRVPNNYQTAFTEKLTKHFDYLCFGDTDHRRALQDFVMNQPMMAALKRGGLDKIMVEHPPEMAYLYDPAMNREQFIQTCAAKLLPAWICDQDAQKNVCQVLDQAITNGQTIRLVPVDERFSGGKDPFSASLPQQIMLIPFQVALTASIILHGCIDEPIFYLAAPFVDFNTSIADDTSTVAAIRNMAKPAAIFYGAGHFKKTVTENSIRNLLEKAGQKICVMNIYERLENANNLDIPGDMPDVQFCMVKPSPDNFKNPSGRAEKLAQISGVYVHDKSLLPVLEQVIAEVDARSAPGPADPALIQG